MAVAEQALRQNSGARALPRNSLDCQGLCDLLESGRAAFAWSVCWFRTKPRITGAAMEQEPMSKNWLPGLERGI